MADQITYDRNEKLGSGGAATVFKGKFDDKIVAVKRVELARLENNQNEEFLINLNHPNVIKLWGLSQDENFR